MPSTLVSRLRFNPPRPVPEALQPVPLGVKGGKPYERRLSALLARAWPVVREALVGVALELGLEEDKLADVVAAHLFDRGAVERPVDGYQEAEQHWTAVEHKLTSIMHDRGLDLDLACASIGLDINKLRNRCVEDPMLEARLEMAFLRGTARLHGAVWDQAMRGKERAAIALLQARDPRFQQSVRVEISEQQIMASPHFQRVMGKVVEALSAVVPEGEAEYRRGWADAMAEARRKVAEELG